MHLKKSNKRRKKMKFLKSVLIFTFAVLLLVSGGYGFFSYNRSCQAFPAQCEEGEGLNISTPLLGQLIIEAAGYYIKSNSDFQLLLREIELSGANGANFAALQELVNSAIENMKMAHSTYWQIWQTSQGLDYDPAVLEKLRQFDYLSYQAENHLVPLIFTKTAKYLKKGDVRGTYRQAYIAGTDILQGLGILKINIEKNMLPQIKDCWRLNQLYLETELFGQYVSEVFFALK
jgi:hypothetical protein